MYNLGFPIARISNPLQKSKSRRCLFNKQSCRCTFPGSRWHCCALTRKQWNYHENQEVEFPKGCRPPLNFQNCGNWLAEVPKAAANYKTVSDVFVPFLARQVVSGKPQAFFIVLWTSNKQNHTFGRCNGSWDKWTKSCGYLQSPLNYRVRYFT